MPPVCKTTQMCEDTPPGSFTCSCPPGTVMNEEGTCVGMHHTQHVIIYITRIINATCMNH